MAAAVTDARKSEVKYIEPVEVEEKEEVEKTTTKQPKSYLHAAEEESLSWNYNRERDKEIEHISRKLIEKAVAGRENTHTNDVCSNSGSNHPTETCFRKSPSDPRSKGSGKSKEKTDLKLSTCVYRISSSTYKMTPFYI